MRKSPKKLVLCKETLKNLEDLEGVVGGKLLPPTNALRICNTQIPCTGDCWTGFCL
jgi:hypothetical protein